jgi:epoxyqueuosine reductase
MPLPEFHPEAALTAERVRALAFDAGFAEAGVVALAYINEEQSAERFEQWVNAGRAGSMGYLERRNDSGELLRKSVQTPFPWARSVVACMASYNSAEARSTAPAAEDAGWIARYAWSSRMDANGEQRPSDYHKVLLKRLKSLAAKLGEECGSFESRAFVDTGPVLERSVATAAGLGWTGKNTCLIHPKAGSNTYLAVLITSLRVEEENAPLAPMRDHCGSCRRCLDACPTDALIAPHQMDATKCIAYLTIEHRGPIAPDLMEGMGRQVFGCDICQDVCPWNRKAVISADPDFAPRTELVNPAMEWLASLDERSFEQRFNGSPVRRAGFEGLRRNLAIAMGNSGLTRFAARLAEWSEASDEGVRTAARWALAKLHRTSTAG